MENQPGAMADDLLSGGDEISAFLGVPKRKIYYWAHRANLPVFRIGCQVCARKSRLTAWIEEQEAAHAAR